MKTTKKLIIAARWEVKIKGKVRSIQLFDKDENKIEGEDARWEGHFFCDSNQLTSLAGAPKEVGGYFNCSDNQLTSLAGAPKEVGGYFNCSDNQLTSLAGAPKEVGGYFNCSYNQLTSLAGAPKEVGGGFSCFYNQLTSLAGAPKEVGGGFSCDSNQLTSLAGAPKEVGGDFSCSYNQLTSLTGAPKEVGGHFYCHSNQLTSLAGAPKEVGGGFNCSDNQLTSLAGAPKEMVENKQNSIKDKIFDLKIVKGYVYADGILEKLISKRTSGDIEIFKTQKIGSMKKGFVVKRGNTFSHGETVKEAMNDLKFKISDRDTTKFKSWTLETIATQDEMIEAYRKITGACASGVKGFLEQRKLPGKLTVLEVIAETQGHYGGSEFEKFFVN